VLLTPVVGLTGVMLGLGDGVMFPKSSVSIGFPGSVLPGALCAKAVAENAMTKEPTNIDARFMMFLLNYLQESCRE
jgi:hypothetical protein